MSERDRPLPPSAARRAAAARAGLFPRSAAVPAGLVLVAVGGAFALFGDRTALGGACLLRQGLQRAVLARTPVDEALGAAFAAGGALALPFLAAALLAAAVGALLPVLVSGRRGSARTAVPLPKIPPAGFGSAVIRLFGALVAGLALISVFASFRSALAELAAGEPAAGRALFTAVARAFAAAGAVLLLAGLAEMALARRRIARSLFVDAAEARREAREAGTDRRAAIEGRRRLGGGVRQ